MLKVFWGGLLLSCCVSWGSDERNLLVNSRFDFHGYVNHRAGRATSYVGSYVACWNASGGDVLQVYRDSHVPASSRFLILGAPVREATETHATFAGRGYFQAVGE